MVRILPCIDRLHRRLARSLHHRALARPLGRVADREIDAALAGLGLARIDLFDPDRAYPPHRRRFSRMLAARRVDLVATVSRYWVVLKRAEHRCAFCESVQRCERWLKSDGRVDDPPWHRNAPRRFCPNAELIGSFPRLDGANLARPETCNPNAHLG